MAQLNLDDGQEISVEYVTLVKATHARLKPKSTEFTQISNPRYTDNQ